MTLTQIEYGSLASSETLNANFNSLQNDVSALSNTINANKASTDSSINTLSTNTNSQINSLTTTVTTNTTNIGNLTTELDTLKNTNNAPNYSAKVPISLPYTVATNGYVYAALSCVDNQQFIYVNGAPVVTGCGYSGGKAVIHGGTFRVSTGDVITSTNGQVGQAYFYPLKGASS